MSDLRETYEAVKNRISAIVFEELWPCFKEYDFALYNDTEVILNEHIFPRTEEFLANTAILYNGKLMAIWCLSEEMDIDVLTAKVIHEMFHAYQNECGESRFPNEMEALFRYEYNPLYLQIKFQENLLLANLVKDFQVSDYKKFLSLRKRRMLQFPYQYMYESSVEVVEGSALYVELQVLKKLNQKRYMELQAECVQRILDKNNLMPIRALCYDVGALLLMVCCNNRLQVNKEAGKNIAYLLPEEVFQCIDTESEIAVDTEFDKFYQSCICELRERINSIVEKYRPVAAGNFELLGVNVYSARYLDGYIYTENFARYKAEETVTLYGDYLLKMQQDRIAEIYAAEAEASVK